MNIALALSGGGFRATVFHLGVLARLAQENRLEDVYLLSTVSGGSLCAGLVYTANQFRWPTSREYLEKVLPVAHAALTQKDLKGALITHTILHFYELGESRAGGLSKLMQDLWGMKISLKDLPPTPRWMINATCYETGKNWRFERFRMGDYVFGYSYDTDLPLSDAVAASAGFPGLIGPLKLDTGRRRWFQYLEDLRTFDLVEGAAAPPKRKTRTVQPLYSPAHLWDGGVYDNQGLEGLHDFEHGWAAGIDFLIVSDASGKSKPEAYRPGVKALYRMVTGIMMAQIRSLRARAVFERIINHRDRGAYLQIGNTVAKLIKQEPVDPGMAQKWKSCLDETEAAKAAYMETDIARLDETTFERLFRHGFEVADYTLYANWPDDFNFLGYKKSG